ncbi:hypothetical protein BDR26DRAFT_390072 [Obelidium mucronatum]|nr:hypothetical protein BDR26DRAFT_390072 [Obelidium mucronatum]
MGRDLDGKILETTRLEQDAWDSARLATNVFYRLASEIMGFNVRYMEYTGGYDNVLGPRLQAGVTDVVMEMWSTGIPVVWFDHGSVGYQGRSGMYIPSWLADKHPTLAFDFWRFFQNPAAGEIVWGKSWKPVVNNDDGTPICTGIARGCLNNTYHPDWWTPATDSRFISMWHIDPSWSQYVYERLIDGLKINATISWLGGTVFNDLVDQALNNGTAFVFYNWKPSTFVATRNVTRLMFPDSDGGLIQKWLLDPVNNPRQADESTTIITKATPMSFGNDFPDVVKLLNLISIAEAEINLLLKNMMVNNWTYDQAVCDWMYRTVDTWKTWIPPPPQVISTCPVGQGFYISSGIPICLTCPPSTYDWEVSDKTCSPCPSGAVCPGGSEVDVKHDHWISPKDWRFNQTEPDIYSCPYAATCCDRSSCKPETPCAEGFTGTLCTKCVDTTKYMWRHTCMNCDSYSGTVAVIVLGSFLATFLLLFVPQHETPTVELLLFYFQVVHLIFGIEITNFNGMQNLEKFLALASLDLDGMTATCPAPLSGVAKQLFRFVLPCLFFIDAAILYNIAKLLKQHYPQLMEKLIVYLPVHSKHISVKVIFIRIFQIIITFVLMPLVEACLAILDCRTVMGRVVDFQAPDVVCFQGYHLPAAIFAIFVLIILLCVYPGFIAWQLYRINKADKLKYDEDEENLTVLDELNMTLYSDYRRSYFFMGPVLIWEKGALVLLFKLLNGKVLGIGFVYVCILAVLW